MLNEMLSLYDYLGKAAGPELGKLVAEYAKTKNFKSRSRSVSNPKYTGKVMLYTKEFLDEYFNKPSLEREISELQDNTLPF
jgi:hypothetical protein